MTPAEVNQIIDAALGARRIVAAGADDDYFRDARFAEVPWLPEYTRRVDDRVWAFELSRGDRISDVTVDAMRRVREIEGRVQTCFLVPAGEPIEHLLPICRAEGIALLAKISDEYELIEVPQAPGAAPQALLRIPDWVLARIGDLPALSPGFRQALRALQQRYTRLVDSGQANDASQESFIRNALKSLLRQDKRFVADFTPVDLLKFFEVTLQSQVRDHYFHSFNIFLLGCLAIDACYQVFEGFRNTCHLTSAGWSTEYTWLLTVLFHDVGYPIQKQRETSEMIYGVAAASEEQMLAERRRVWDDSPEYRAARAQLLSLYDYLVQDDIDGSWTADPFPAPIDHPLDRAFEKAFLTEGHGVASCMRMIAGFYRAFPSSIKHRQFLVRHVILAGLSIPFHDWPVRVFLREQGIARIVTSRFPFAALLMFIDSIQEDRRGVMHEPDVLRGLTVDTLTVVADMQLDLLGASRLNEKRREALDITSFLEQDRLAFRYPDQLRAMGPAPAGDVRG